MDHENQKKTKPPDSVPSHIHATCFAAAETLPKASCAKFGTVPQASRAKFGAVPNASGAKSTAVPEAPCAEFGAFLKASCTKFGAIPKASCANLVWFLYPPVLFLIPSVQKRAAPKASSAEVVLF